LLEDDETRQNLVFPLRHGREKVEICIIEDKNDPSEWIALKDLKQVSGERDTGRVYKYCCALLDLASELCLERNHRALNYLTEIYPLQTVLTALTNSQLDYNIRSKFVRMAENMYINREPFDHMKVPNYTRIWSEISLIGNRICHYKGDIPEHVIHIK
jgi:hypothetical protein